MTQNNHSWARTIETALRRLGGSASLGEMGPLVQTLREKAGLALPATWKATVRRTLQQHPLTVQDRPGSGVWRLISAKPDRKSLKLELLPAKVQADAWAILCEHALVVLECEAAEREIFAVVKQLRIVLGLSVPVEYRAHVREALDAHPCIKRKASDQRVWRLKPRRR